MQEVVSSPGLVLGSFFGRLFNKEEAVNPALLLPRVALGEDPAFRECLATYGKLVYGIARRFLRDGRDIEEAVQDIFIALWRSAGSFDPSRGSEVTFVAMIARRRLVDRQRSAGARPLPLGDTGDTPDAPVPATMESYVDARFAASALAELGEDQRRVILLAALQGMTHDEISKELSLPLGTVKSHYARGVERVKRALEKART